MAILQKQFFYKRRDLGDPVFIQGIKNELAVALRFYDPCPA
jgi:hypothetical protein